MNASSNNPRAEGRQFVRVTYDLAMDESRLSLRGVIESLGWSEKLFSLTVPGLEAPCPYEFEIETPDGIDLTDARTVTEPAGATTIAAQSRSARIGRFVRVSQASVRPEAAIVLSVRMRPQRSYPFAVLLTASIATLILTWGWRRLGALADAPDAAVAVLLAVPVLFATLIAQPGRGSPAARLVTGARAILVVCGILTYLAAVVLVLYPGQKGTQIIPLAGLLRTVWFIDTAACWGLVFVLLAPLYGPAFQGWRRRRAMRDPARRLPRRTSSRPSPH
jgi:hypothetical protein